MGAIHRAVFALVLLLSGCGLTVTNERPAYEDLTATERSAVDIILEELRTLETRVRDRSVSLFQEAYDLSPIVDRQRIDVAFKDMMVAYNLGDGVVHVATWDNLAASQRAAVERAFDTTPGGAKTRYETLFYRVVGVSQGAKQFMYNVGSVEKAFSSFSAFNLELHPMRMAMAYFRDEGRDNIWSFTDSVCAPVLSQNEDKWGHMFTEEQSLGSPRFPLAKAFLKDNRELFVRGLDSTVGLYFICQWCKIARQDAESFDAELRWLHSKLH